MSEADQEIRTGIHVSFRARPLNKFEVESGETEVIRPGLERGSIFLQPLIRDNHETSRHQTEKNYTCDEYFGPEDDTSFIYCETAKNLIPRLTEGFNCSVFCYGSTGTGKTHTMFGTTESPGLVPLVIQDVLRAQKPGHQIKATLTAVEVYGNRIRDLLTGRRDPADGSSLRRKDEVTLHQDDYGIHLCNVRCARIETFATALELVHLAKSSRVTHSTNANDQSSRSHCILQIKLEIRGNFGELRKSKINLIDLAGSERVNQTGLSMGQRMTEACNINSSLLALKQCISGLAQGKEFVPFRDSKLTRLLQDCLQGSCLTYFIACVSPASGQWQSTRDTLEYGTQARSINMKAKSQFRPVLGLREQIEYLKEQNQNLILRVRAAEKEAYKAEHYRKELQQEFAHKEEVAEAQRLQQEREHQFRMQALERETQRKQESMRLQLRAEIEKFRRNADAATVISEEEAKIIEYKEELQAQAEGRQCVICLDRAAVCAFIPCGHRTICVACKPAYESTSHRRCPICKQKYSKILRIFL